MFWRYLNMACWKNLGDSNLKHYYTKNRSNTTTWVSEQLKTKNLRQLNVLSGSSGCFHFWFLRFALSFSVMSLDALAWLSFDFPRLWGSRWHAGTGRCAFEPHPSPCGVGSRFYSSSFASHVPLKLLGSLEWRGTSHHDLGLLGFKPALKPKQGRRTSGCRWVSWFHARTCKDTQRNTKGTSTKGYSYQPSTECFWLRCLHI